MKKLLLLCCWLLISPLWAYQTVDKDMPSGETLSITEFNSDGETLILWIPSERGYRKAALPVILELADRGIDVQVVHIHTSYMLETGRQSYTDFNNQDLLQLLEDYKKQGFKRVFMMSSGRGAALSLQLARDWQLKHPNQTLLRGFIFTDPHLIEGRPEIGKKAQYVAAASLTNLPVYLFQPEFSTKYAVMSEIYNVLIQGGSAVFRHPLKGIRGGYYMRPEDDLSEVDLQAKTALASKVEQAIKLMSSLPLATHAVATQQKLTHKPAKASFRSAQLYPFKGNPVPPSTVLHSFDGKPFELKSLRGKVVIVNFWATWCGPCIEEIPSLNRLSKHMQDKPFKVLGVNIGETKQQINDFLTQLNSTGGKIDFPIVLDQKGNAVRDWKVYAYPSNFLLDKKGNIRYAYRGALQWDAADVISTIESLL